MADPGPGRSLSGLGVAPDPPDYTKCIAALKKQESGAKEADLKKQCREMYRGMREQVMGFLIQSQWIIQEAERQGIEISDADLRAKFEGRRGACWRRRPLISDAQRRA